jgi:hypothetical protein
VKTKLVDLQQQWEKRKDRYDDFMFPTDITPDMNVNVASLNTPARLPVQNVHEGVEGEEFFLAEVGDGSANLFLDMIQKINSSTEEGESHEI